MPCLPWRKIILFILIITILIGSSGCQSRAGKALDNTLDAFSQVPHRLVQVFTNLMGGLSDIGGALAEQVKNIVQGMTKR